MAKTRKPAEPSSVPLKDASIPFIKGPEKIYWSFSFRYYRQIEYFGLLGRQSTWFVSLLDRLQELSRTEIDSVLEYNPEVRSGIRYHEIDWEAKNIPIQRKNCNWVDKFYLDDDETYPFVQFHISKALGRVIGFWNENSQIFHIVFLDPMHNMQPAKVNSYKLRSSNPLSCQYSALLQNLESLKDKTKACTKCEYAKHLATLPTNHISTNAVICFIDDTYLEELKRRVIDEERNLSSIIEIGLIAMT